MRASVIAALLMIGLLAVGLRLHAARCSFVAEVAHAQEPAPPLVEAPKVPAPAERKGGGTTLISRIPQTAPIWKHEVTSEFQSSAEAARKDALRKASDQLAKYLDDRFPGYRYQPTPKFLIDHRMVDDVPMETKLIEADPEAPPMYKQKVTVELRDMQLAQLLQEDRRERSVERLWQGGRVLGGLVVALLALISYVRLDDWTKGYFSLALKFSALALAVAGVVLLWWLV